jgi:hypothetical protein
MLRYLFAFLAVYSRSKAAPTLFLHRVWLGFKILWPKPGLPSLGLMTFCRYSIVK